jgi:hypothetical protein
MGLALFSDWRKYKTYVIGAICAVGFFLGLPMTTGVSPGNRIIF